MYTLDFKKYGFKQKFGTKVFQQMKSKKLPKEKSMQLSV